MRAAGRLQLAVPGELLPGVLAHRLQHAEGRIAILVVLPVPPVLSRWQHQALLRQRRHPLQHAPLVRTVRVVPRVAHHGSERIKGDLARKHA